MRTRWWLLLAFALPLAAQAPRAGVTALDAAGGWLAVGDVGGGVEVREASTGELVASLRLEGPVAALAFGAEPADLWVAPRSGTLERWNWKSDTRQSVAVAAAWLGLAAAPRVLASGSLGVVDGAGQVVRPGSMAVLAETGDGSWTVGTPEGDLELHRGEATVLVPGVRARRVAACASGWLVAGAAELLFVTPTGTVAWRRQVDQSVTALAANGEDWYAGTEQGRVLTGSLADGRTGRSWSAGLGRVTALALAEPQRLVSATTEPALALWGLPEAKKLGSLAP